MPIADTKYVSDEMELYHELRSCTDEDELLTVMSEIQGHFKEELERQQAVAIEALQARIKQQKEEAKASAKKMKRGKSGSNVFQKKKAAPVALTNIPSGNANKKAFNFGVAPISTNTDPSNLVGTAAADGKRHLDLSIPLLTPRTKTGTYRLDLFCDIKFVKNIFLRWISCENEVLAHVTARTVSVLFSHAYLNSDQFLDLAELLLGVHENFTPLDSVAVTYRPSRSGTLTYGGDTMDSSSDDMATDTASESGTRSPSMESNDSSIDFNTARKGSNDSSDFNVPRKGSNNSENSPPMGADLPLNATHPKGLLSLDMLPEDQQLTVIEDTVDIIASDGTPKRIRGPPSDMPLPFGTETEEKKGDDENLVPPTPQTMIIREVDDSPLPGDGRQDFVMYSSSDDSDDGRRRSKKKAGFTINWNNRLYSAMRVLSTIVESEEVHDDCVVALDEWFATVVMEFFSKCSKAGFGILEAFLELLKSIFYRFARDPVALPPCQVGNALAITPDALLDIITRRTSPLTTRSIALELCPLLMVVSPKNNETFAQKCLDVILDDGRFNPFEPAGDIHMSRTFKRDMEEGKIRSVNPKNPFQKGYTLNEYIPTLLFQQQSDVFVDKESVMRLNFMTIIKAMNTVAQRMDEAALVQERMASKSISNMSQLMSPQPTPTDGGSIGGDFEDDLATVDRLEGEFDNKTARKIRNFLSRDANYTRMRILELLCEEDDVLIDTLLELLMIETTLRRSTSRLAKRIRYLFDPFMLFHDFLTMTEADHSLLLDWLISTETTFLHYLLRFCKRMCANWHPSAATQEQVNRVMSVLIRLRMQIQHLMESNLFPFNPKSLLKAMDRMEFCYETEGGAYAGLKKKRLKLAGWSDLFSQSNTDVANDTFSAARVDGNSPPPFITLENVDASPIATANGTITAADKDKHLKQMSIDIPSNTVNFVRNSSASVVKAELAVLARSPNVSSKKVQIKEEFRKDELVHKKVTFDDTKEDKNSGKSDKLGKHKPKTPKKIAIKAIFEQDKIAAAEAAEAEKEKKIRKEKRKRRKKRDKKDKNKNAATPTTVKKTHKKTMSRLDRSQIAVTTINSFLLHKKDGKQSSKRVRIGF